MLYQKKRAVGSWAGTCQDKARNLERDLGGRSYPIHIETPVGRGRGRDWYVRGPNSKVDGELPRGQEGGESQKEKNTQSKKSEEEIISRRETGRLHKRAESGRKVRKKADNKGTEGDHLDFGESDLEVGGLNEKKGR